MKYSLLQPLGQFIIAPSKRFSPTLATLTHAKAAHCLPGRIFLKNFTHKHSLGRLEATWRQSLRGVDCDWPIGRPTWRAAELFAPLAWCPLGASGRASIGPVGCGYLARFRKKAGGKIIIKMDRAAADSLWQWACCAHSSHCKHTTRAHRPAHCCSIGLRCTARPHRHSLVSLGPQKRLQPEKWTTPQSNARQGEAK